MLLNMSSWRSSQWTRLVRLDKAVDTFPKRSKFRSRAHTSRQMSWEAVFRVFSRRSVES